MKAAVVAWTVSKGELNMGELTEAVNWIICQQLPQQPQIYFTRPSYPHMPVKHGSQTVMGSTNEFAYVVTDVPITQEQADDIMAQYYGEDDARGIPYRRRHTGRDTSTPAEQGPAEH